MEIEGVFPYAVFEVAGIAVRDSVVVTWAIMALLALASWLSTRRLSDRPRPLQNAMEATLEVAESLIGESTSYDPRHFLPLIYTLAVFLAAASVVALVPGVGSPTRDLNTPLALAGIVFVSVHVYGWRLAGPARYLRGYVKPSWVLLPFNVISEVTRTIALALRLFGNTLSGELVVAVLVLLSGLLVPVPMQLFGLLIGFIQAYVFTLLAMVYIASALGVPPMDLQPARTEPS